MALPDISDIERYYFELKLFVVVVSAISFGWFARSLVVIRKRRHPNHETPIHPTVQ